MTPQLDYQTITIHISQVKQITKFGQLIEYNKRNSVL